MTQPNDDAQVHVDKVASHLESKGWYGMASLLRSGMPDADVTNMGGLGTEQFVGAMTDGAMTQFRQGPFMDNIRKRMGW